LVRSKKRDKCRDLLGLTESSDRMQSRHAFDNLSRVRVLEQRDLDESGARIRDRKERVPVAEQLSDLIDRPVAITGGGSGVGPATLLASARRGATLAVGGFDEPTHQ
jgi:hypothetical protein